MQVFGRIVSGAMRGDKLIDLYYPRLSGILGFKPYKGTMDVKLEKRIDIKLYSTKTLEHVLMDGSKMVYAYFAPVTITIRKVNNEEQYKCWAMQQAESVYGNDVVELIAEEHLKDKFSLKDGDTITLEFTQVRKQKESFLKKFKTKSTRQLMKR